MSVSPIFPTKFSLEDNGQVANTGQFETKNVSISYTLGEVSLASASNLGVVSDYDLIDFLPEATPAEDVEPAESAPEADEAVESERAQVNLEEPSDVSGADSPEFHAAPSSAVETAGARYTPTQYALAIAGGVAAGILTVYVVNKRTER